MKAINKNNTPEFYEDLPEVRVLSILDYRYFDCEEYISSYKILKYDDKEVTKSKIGSSILSWDFIELPKFGLAAPELKSSMDRWLYLLNRRDEERVVLSGEVLGDDTALESAYRRLSCLSKEEERALEYDKKGEMDTMAVLGSSYRDGVREGEKKAEKKSAKKISKLKEEKNRLKEEKVAAENRSQQLEDEKVAAGE